MPVLPVRSDGKGTVSKRLKATLSGMAHRLEYGTITVSGLEIIWSAPLGHHWLGITHLPGQHTIPFVSEECDLGRKTGLVS